MRTIQDLRQLQAYPLELKVKLTKQRIREWVNHFGTDGVYVSFSGGKDSTVLLHIVREMYPDIPAVFCDTGLEYPEIREFVKTFDNVVWIKPEITFKKVIETYGYPFVSKEVSFSLNGAKKFLENKEQYADRKPLPVQDSDDEYKPYALLRLEGKIGKANVGKGHSQFNCTKWYFMLEAPYSFGSRCCDIMKKHPFKEYLKRSKRVPITAQMTSESRLRKKNWLMHGCNMFDAERPISNPMSFWCENDVLQYIQQNNLPLCSVYGDIVEDEGLPGQMSWDDYAGFDIGSKKLTTTGCKRTGCMFCGYGCHLEKPGEGRFERMKETHPKQYEYIMKPWSEGGLGYKDVIDWLNEHGELHIRY